MKNDLSSYFEDPEFKEALAKYEGMVESHTPAYFDADELTDIAEYYASKERHDDADKVIDLALQLHPNDTDALIFRARSLALKGKLKEAYMVADLIEDKSDREVKFLQADLLMEENRMEEADEVFNQLAIHEEEDLETLLDILLAYIDTNQEKYAEKWFLRIGQNHDMMKLPLKDQRFRDVISDYYITFNTPAMALPFLRMTLDEHPYSIQHWNSTGSCHLQLGNFEEAHEALDFSLAIDDKNEEALALKAYCFRQSGNLQEACNYYLKLSKVSENKARSYLALAKLYLDTHEYESALDYLQILLEEKSELSDYELAELYCDVALSHAALGHSGKGQKYIDEALKLNGDDPNICISAGRFYLAEDNNEEKATLLLEKALELAMKEDRLDCLLSISSACFDIRNYSLSVHYFDMIEKEFPEHAKATYFFLLYSYFRLQQVTPCMHYLAKIKMETPDLYNEIDTNADLVGDDNFLSLMRELKENVSNGKIDLDKYL